MIFTQAALLSVQVLVPALLLRVAGGAAHGTDWCGRLAARPQGLPGKCSLPVYTLLHVHLSILPICMCISYLWISYEGCATASKLSVWPPRCAPQRASRHAGLACMFSVAFGRMPACLGAPGVVPSLLPCCCHPATSPSPVPSLSAQLSVSYLPTPWATGGQQLPAVTVCLPAARQGGRQEGQGQGDLLMLYPWPV